MEACAITIHAVEMFDSVRSIRQIARAIWTLITEQLTDELSIFFPVNLNRPVLTDLAT